MSPPTPAPSAPIVRIAAGRLRGARHEGVSRFLAVPYAAPPVGARRLAVPERTAPWDGIRDATAPGPNAPQGRRPFALDLSPVIGTGWRPGDDYLTANVWTPDPGAGHLPVMVFIHGGGSVVGDKDVPVHDGAAFARSGVVCVTFNYRLGIEGFLPIPGIPTNLGLRDQVAALEWVRANAAAFGGDPSAITVFGESAGGMTLASLIASPSSHGLIRRAIVQSGHGSMVRPIPIARKLVHELAARLGIAPDAAGFRGCSVERCLGAVDALSRSGEMIDLRDATGREPAYGLTRFLPVIGDDVLPEAPLTALARGVGKDCQLLIGTNREEMNLYFVPSGIRAHITDDKVLAALQAVEPRAGALLEVYRGTHPGLSAGELYSAVTTDLVFRWPARRFAAAHQGSVHLYEFGWRSCACNGALGACHALELPFVFNTLACCTGPDALAGAAPPQALADRVHGLWVEFARSGRLPWPQYEPGSRQVYALERSTAETDGDFAACAALAS